MKSIHPCIRSALLAICFFYLILPSAGQAETLITQTPDPPTYTPSPTATVHGGDHYLVVNSLPQCSDDLAIQVSGSTVPYSNIDIWVNDLESSTQRHYYQWTNGSAFSVTVLLYDNTLNGITVRSCGDVYPPPCTTIAYTTLTDLIVDTGDCTTSTPSPTATPTPTRTPSPSPTPTETGTPTPYGHFQADVNCHVRDMYSGLPVADAIVHTQSLTEAYCGTNESGECTTTILMDELGYVIVNVDAAGYLPFSDLFPTHPGGLTVYINLQPIGTPTPPPSAPTSTPTAAPTSTPPEEPSPTPSPAPCDVPGVSIKMPAHEFHAGDPCWLDVMVCNPTEETWDTFRLLILLEVYDQFFFAPSWSTDFDWLDEEFPPGLTTIRLFEFAWPAGMGETPWFRFYAGLCTEDMTQLIGGIDFWEFRGV